MPGPTAFVAGSTTTRSMQHRLSNRSGPAGDSASPYILAINGGSSSIRFAVYEAGEALRRRCDGKIDRIGLKGTNLVVENAAGKLEAPRRLVLGDHRTAVEFLLDWLETQPFFVSIKAVGHRVVHGMKHSEPERLTPKLLAELHRITPYDPDHLKREIALIEAIVRRHPKLPQVACFDTAFHRTMPRVAKLLPIPRRYAAKGMERYGFHGLSYAYLLEELVRLGDPAATEGRVILAHLGNGASLAAVHLTLRSPTKPGFNGAAPLLARIFVNNPGWVEDTAGQLQWGRAIAGADIAMRRSRDHGWRRFNGAAPLLARI